MDWLSMFTANSSYPVILTFVLGAVVRIGRSLQIKMPDSALPKYSRPTTVLTRRKRESTLPWAARTRAAVGCSTWLGAHGWTIRNSCQMSLPSIHTGREYIASCPDAHFRDGGEPGCNVQAYL